MVGVRGFEPPAPASRRQCSTRLSYTPIIWSLPVSAVAACSAVHTHGQAWRTSCPTGVMHTIPQQLRGILHGPLHGRKHILLSFLCSGCAFVWTSSHVQTPRRLYAPWSARRGLSRRSSKSVGGSLLLLAALVGEVSTRHREEPPGGALATTGRDYGPPVVWRGGSR